MNFNFSSFLNGTLRILNIASKTLPLIKEASPTIKTLKEKYQNFKKKNVNNTPKALPLNNPKVLKRPDDHNLPTFFK